MFPELLRNISGAPKQLFIYSENWDYLCNAPKVAIVGCRFPTQYGRETTELFASTASRCNQVIVSGLAYGVDIIAHRVALRQNTPTIAVLAGGLNKVYPASHKTFIEPIVKQGGAIVSEQPLDIEPKPYRFIQRNRIISGLCQATIITEASLKSGTLHTASFTLDQGRDLMVVPGSIFNENSLGANSLIATGGQPLLGCNDLYQYLGFTPPTTNHYAPANKYEKIILDLLGNGAQDNARLLQDSGMTVSIFSQTITILEINQAIVPVGANRWRLL